MTITKPTLIVTDRTGIDFALLFEDEGLNLKEKGYKKGYTIVVPNARRTDREGEGKKAVVRVPKGGAGDVKVSYLRLLDYWCWDGIVGVQDYFITEDCCFLF